MIRFDHLIKIGSTMTDYTNEKNQKFAILKMTDPFELMFKDHYICLDDNTGYDYVEFDRKSVDFRHVVESFMKQFFNNQAIDVDDALKEAFSHTDDQLNLVFRDQAAIFADESYDVDLTSDTNFVHSDPVRDGLASLKILMMQKVDKKEAFSKLRKMPNNK